MDDSLTAALAAAKMLDELEWYRDGGEISERQWGDVVGVLSLNRDKLDLELLRQSAEEIGVTDLLQRALSEAGVIMD